MENFTFITILFCDLLRGKELLFKMVTYMAEMPQWLPALSPAELYRDKPISEIVGAMVKGPIKRMRKPMRPEKPTRIWRTEATMIEPCNCGQKQKHTKHFPKCFAVAIIMVVLFLKRQPQT